MDYSTPHDTVLQNAKNWRTSAQTLRTEAAQKLAQAEALEARADQWERAASKLAEPA